MAMILFWGLLFVWTLAGGILFLMFISDLRFIDTPNTITAILILGCGPIAWWMTLWCVMSNIMDRLGDWWEGV